MHPRGVVGRSVASKISLICPRPRRSGGRSRPVSSARAALDRPGAPSATRRRSARSARPTPCPGGTPRRARAGRRRSSPCSPGAPARACAAPPASAARRRTTSSTGSQRSLAQHRVSQRDREHLVGPDGRIVSALSPSTTSKQAAVRSAFQKRSLKDCRARARPLPMYGCAIRASVARAQPAISRSALYQSALISTALPRRGVTTQSSDLRVHPRQLIALLRPAAAARPPDRRRCRSACPRRWCSTMSTQRGEQVAAAARGRRCASR